VYKRQRQYQAQQYASQRDPDKAYQGEEEQGKSEQQGGMTSAPAGNELRQGTGNHGLVQGVGLSRLVSGTTVLPVPPGSHTATRPMGDKLRQAIVDQNLV
jgi:hypothetical protein